MIVISAGISLKFQVDHRDFQWYSIEISNEFQLDLKLISIVKSIEFQGDFQLISIGILLKFSLVFNYNFNWISNRIPLANWYSIEISIEFQLDSQWISISIEVQFDFQWFLPLVFH